MKRDIVDQRETGRKVCLAMGLPTGNFNLRQTVGESTETFRRRNGYFLIEVLVDVTLLPALGEIEAWAICDKCDGAGYMPLIWPFSSWYKRCKKCVGKGGWWYITS